MPTSLNNASEQLTVVSNKLLSDPLDNPIAAESFIGAISNSIDSENERSKEHSVSLSFFVLFISRIPNEKFLEVFKE